MKRFAHFRWSPLLVFAFLAMPLLPPPAVAQSATAREKEEQALREMQERLAQFREQEARIQLLAEEARLRSPEFRDQSREAESELRVQLEHLQQEQLAREQEREQELRVRLERVAQERRIRSEEARQMARELAVRVRARSEAERALREDRIRDIQQVVVRVRARARLGVSLNGTQGEEYDRQGARITDVVEDSPADEAGLQEGDIITHLDGNSLLAPIPGEEDMEFGEETSLPVQRLMALARELEDGQEVEVRYLRDGASATVTLEAAKLDEGWVTVMPRESGMGVYRLDPEGSRSWRYTFPEGFHVQVLPHLRDFDIEIPEFEYEGFEIDSLHGWNIWKEGGPDIRVFRGEGAPGVAFFRSGENPAFGIWGGRVHGLELRKLNADLGEYFSVSRGVLVLEVDEDSTLGLLPGDVILAIGDREVEDTQDVYRILRSYEEDEAVTFRVMRKGREARVEGTVE
jgi:C-terminal processing protease CtpA/Prc